MTTGMSQAAGKTCWRWNIHDIRESSVHISRTRQQTILRQAQIWVIEDTAISVGCLGYTLGVPSRCAVLVVSGLLTGFRVGSSIDGVDPFTLTMFPG